MYFDLDTKMRRLLMTARRPVTRISAHTAKTNTVTIVVNAGLPGRKLMNGSMTNAAPIIASLIK